MQIYIFFVNPFLLPRFCSPFQLARSRRPAPGGHLLVGRTWWAAPGGPLRPELSCGGGYLGTGEVLLRGEYLGTGGALLPRPPYRARFWRKRSRSVPEKPLRARIRHKRSRSAAVRAPTRAFSSESCAKLGVRGRNAHTFARIVRETRGEGPERAHFRPKRAQNSGCGAGTSALSPESCANTGVKG